MKPLIPLDHKELWGNDAGEDEDPQVLASYFFEHTDFVDFMNFENKYCIARARKGMGKSALLSKVAYDVDKMEGENLVLRRVRSNFVGTFPPPETDDHSRLEAYWKESICRVIVAQIGAFAGLSFSQDMIDAVDVAEALGSRPCKTSEPPQRRHFGA